MSIRLSDDLPEGEGTNFVTAVPGAKFHVSGRRDPKTGEGSLIVTTRGKRITLKPLRSILRSLPPVLDLHQKENGDRASKH
jgi:hypothetical protein